VLLLCQKLLIRLKKLVNAYRHDRFCNPSFPRRAGGALMDSGYCSLLSVNRDGGRSENWGAGASSKVGA
jgi:hypothetical protein